MLRVITVSLLMALAAGAADAGDITGDKISNADALAAVKQALDGKGVQNSFKVGTLWGVFQEDRRAIIYFRLSGLDSNMGVTHPFSDIIK